uniref:Uncharacterized protein n=1 Tax=Arundo donax TaxID=35708 RepID=A0A0A9A9N9_ARUDO
MLFTTGAISKAFFLEHRREIHVIALRRINWSLLQLVFHSLHARHDKFYI